MPSNYPAYLGLAILLVIAPGPDFAVVTKNSLMYGPSPGLLTSFGVISSLLIQGTAAALGVAALVVRSALAFNVLKVAGAAYLGYLGAQALWSALRRRSGDRPAAQAGAGQAAQTAPAQERRRGRSPRGTLVRAWRQGFLSNITNPKVLAFYFSLLPQFVDQTHPALPQVLVLAGTHAFFALVWLLIVVAVLDRLQRFLRRPRAQRVLEGFTGLALVGFGLRLISAAPKP